MSQMDVRTLAGSLLLLFGVFEFANGFRGTWLHFAAATLFVIAALLLLVPTDGSH